MLNEVIENTERFIASVPKAKRKKYGQFFTNSTTAKFMASLFCFDLSKQKIEILKALARGAEILILDEPTAVLAPQETDQLFDELINLKKQGHTIVFISHKIPEIKRISDRITVMRASQFVGCCETKDVTEQEISAMIMGCEMDTSIQKTVPKPGDVKIQVKNLSYTDKNQVKLLNNIDFWNCRRPRKRPGGAGGTDDEKKND